jgi:DNA-binding HxlR family transcriptional regulator
MRDQRFFAAECPMTRAMVSLGSKWKPIIIHTIHTRKIRFGQLDAIIPLITRKVLTQQLNEMEEDGILIRQEFAELPPRVEYSLTEKGLALLPILKSVCEWNMFYENTKMCDLKNMDRENNTEKKEKV